jgi:hypothetical protein
VDPCRQAPWTKQSNGRGSEWQSASCSRTVWIHGAKNAGPRSSSDVSNHCRARLQLTCRTAWKARRVGGLCLPWARPALHKGQTGRASRALADDPRRLRT